MSLISICICMFNSSLKSDADNALLIEGVVRSEDPQQLNISDENHQEENHPSHSTENSEDDSKIEKNDMYFRGLIYYYFN